MSSMDGRGLEDILFHLSQDDTLAVQRLALMRTNARILNSHDLSVRDPSHHSDCNTGISAKAKSF